MDCGWHGTDAVIPLFRQVLTTDPDDLETRLYLGMSLYDTKRYDEAITVFEELFSRAASDSNNRRLFDWSRIWLGHVYDAKGERTMALNWYQAVADDGAPESEMSFSQYGIRMTSAVDWARKRLSTPFYWPRR
jgi:tetratricopeptide (TPR) repeat protein